MCFKNVNLKLSMIMCANSSLVCYKRRRQTAMRDGQKRQLLLSIDAHERLSTRLIKKKFYQEKKKEVKADAVCQTIFEIFTKANSE